MFSVFQVDPSWIVDPSKFELDEERVLHTAVQGVRQAVNPSSASVEEFLQACTPLYEPINAYFEKVREVSWKGV